MIEQTDLAGSFTLPGASMTVNRMGYDAMQHGANILAVYRRCVSTAKAGIVSASKFRRSNACARY